MNDNIFGKRLRELRTEYNMSQDDLCEKLKKEYDADVKKSIISRYENGIHLPKFTLVQQLADIFRISTDYLMGLSNGRYSYAVIDLDLRKVPMLGIVRAGDPILMLEDYDEYEYTDNKMVDFALRVTGDSMIGARIYKGDIVYIQQQPDVDNGEIALVAVDDESATIKRVYKEKGKVILHPENPSMKDSIFTRTDVNRLKIIGKVIEVKFKI